MKTVLIACAAIILGFASIAVSAEAQISQPRHHHSRSRDMLRHMLNDPVGKVPWTAANIDKLRAFDEAAIIRFLDLSSLQKLFDFGWFDLAGDGRYELAAIIDQAGGPDAWYPRVSIYWPNPKGKVGPGGNEEEFDVAAPRLDKTFRDLNGDGKLEMVLPSDFGWPQVNRFENGAWVDASRDFPKFYDNEVLPQLDKDIDEARENAAKHQGEPGPAPGDPFFREAERAWRQPQRDLADLLMERDKILRVLGRDPDAGLANAREWVKSDDPELVRDALDVFDDTGGHEQELKAAKSALILLDPSEAETLRIEEGK